MTKPMTREEAVAMIDRQLADAAKRKADQEAAEQAAIEENRKTLLSPESLKALAEAVRKQPGFGCPQWHEGRWVWLSPHGDARSRCGSPMPPPEEVLPHQVLLWAKCQNCGTRRPWGGLQRQRAPQPAQRVAVKLTVVKLPVASCQLPVKKRGVLLRLRLNWELVTGHW